MNCLVLCISWWAVAADPGYRVLDCRAGRETTLDAAAVELARHDVVFLGEDHDQSLGHKLELELLIRLRKLRPDLALSLEMFERDCQGALDDYLRGRLDEAAFLKVSRPWRNYRDDYRPLVELAREHKLDVLAANVPRPAAKSVSEGESPAPEWRRWLPRDTSAPRDVYREQFVAAMQGHGGVSPATLEQY